MIPPAILKDTACWFIFQNDLLLLTQQNHQYQLLTEPILTTIKPYFLRQLTLGQFNQTECYCAEIAKDTQIPKNTYLVSLRKAFELLGNAWLSIIVKAYSIIHWDKNHQFCGRCGNTTVHKAGIFERICPSCGLTVYPRISPSIIVLIKNNKHILMARSPHFIPGAYGLIAGFVEAGENIEEAVHREVREEVGIEIKNLRYFGSQPWPFPDSLMIGFIADYAAGEINIDHHEIEAADWYPIDHLPYKPTLSSIARKLIDHVTAELK